MSIVVALACAIVITFATSVLADYNPTPGPMFNIDGTGGHADGYDPGGWDASRQNVEEGLGGSDGGYIPPELTVE